MSKSARTCYKFKMKYCRVSNSRKKHKRILTHLCQKLMDIANACIMEYEEKNNCSLSGSVDFDIRDLYEARFPNLWLSRCSARMECEHSSEIQEHMLDEWWKYCGNCTGMSFYYSDGRRLEQISMRMEILGAEKEHSYTEAANELEVAIIRRFNEQMPRSNKYERVISRRAMHRTAKTILWRFGAPLRDDFGAYVKHATLYGFDEQRDMRLLASVWTSAKTREKEGVFYG